LATFAIIGCGGNDAPEQIPEPEYHPYDAPPISESLKAEFLSAVNEARSVGRICGVHGYRPPVPPVVWSDELYSAAYEHTEDMVTAGYFNHAGSGTASDWTAQVLDLGRGSGATERGYNNGFYGGIGENLTRYTHSTEQTVSGLLESEHHCKTIMTGYTHLGMATLNTYYTMMLGAY